MKRTAALSAVIPAALLAGLLGCKKEQGGDPAPKPVTETPVAPETPSEQTAPPQVAPAEPVPSEPPKPAEPAQQEVPETAEPAPPGSATPETADPATPPAEASKNPQAKPGSGDAPDDKPATPTTAEECQAAGGTIAPSTGGQPKCPEGKNAIGSIRLGIEGGLCCK